MNYGIKEFRLFSLDDICDSRRRTKSNIIKEFGFKCPITDFAILLGGTPNSGSLNIPNDSSLKGRTGCWFLSTPFKDGVHAFMGNESELYNYFDSYNVSNRGYCIRPVFSFTKDINFHNLKKIGKHLYEFEYGEYPQYVVDDEKVFLELTDMYVRNRLTETGKKYTIDDVPSTDHELRFRPSEITEYEYNGKKYVLVTSNCGFFDQKMSNGLIVSQYKQAWVEVSPIEWYFDDKEKIIASKRCLAAGIRFCDEKQYNGDFKSTEMYTFLNDYFAKDIIPAQFQKNGLNRPQNISEAHYDIKKVLNPNAFDFKDVSEEDIIKGAVESNVPVFLHGRSSEGKSARIKELDSDCEIIYMRNATPESLNGKSVYNQATGEMIDVKPSWLVKLEEKCEREPDKIHIVFFDELTNALPSIQGMAFNIVLDREVNGKWELPKNARIAAAGNDMNDSLAANQMAEPLFNRFAHVYINTTKEDWLKWAITPEEDYKRLDYKEEQPPLKIHPAIYTYIASNNGSALRTEYNGETPNADPRKWEMASKVLYKTKNPQMLRALVGEDITRDFIEFCNQEVIPLNDVITDNYEDYDIETLNKTQKYSTIMGLSRAKEEDVEKVRKFVMKMGPEFGAIFDALWTHGDERRLELIAEIKLGESEKENGGINNGR